MDILKVKHNGQWIGIPAVQGPPGPMGPQGAKGDPAEIDIATEEMLQAIIDDYPYDEGDEGMVFVANFVNPQSGDPYYVTEADRDDIVAAYEAGKHVIIHFVESEGSQEYNCYDASTSVTSCNHVAANGDPGVYCGQGDSGSLGGYISVSHPSLTDNNKLKFSVYVD